MAPVSERQIKALIHLLSDTDERVANTIRAQLVQAGPAAVPLLQEAKIDQPQMAERISLALDEIRGFCIEEEFRTLLACREDHIDLERGAFLIARYAYPDLDERSYAHKLDEMAGVVRDRLGHRASGEEAVKTLGRCLFTEEGFRGNTREYYEVDNSYLNRVIDRRTGVPISLSLVYLFVAKRLGLPVFGIGMPGHFLVKFESQSHTVFIDCFNAGALLTTQDCTRFLMQAGYGFDERYLEKSSPRAILIRSLRNLIPIYHKLDDTVKHARLTRFIQVLECGCPEDAT